MLPSTLKGMTTVSTTAGLLLNPMVGLLSKEGCASSNAYAAAASSDCITHQLFYMPEGGDSLRPTGQNQNDPNTVRGDKIWNVKHCADSAACSHRQAERAKRQHISPVGHGALLSVSR